MSNNTQKFDVLIVGNGVLGCTTAIALTKLDPKLKIALVGAVGRPGAASAAAGAMLNSFAEIEYDTLSSEMGRFRFEMNRKATAMWQEWGEELRNAAKPTVDFKVGEGTCVINNARTDALDDHNFNAVLKALKEFNEPHEYLEPNDIQGYNPDARGRALRAVYIPGEGHFPSGDLFAALDCYLAKLTNITIFPGEAQTLALGKGTHSVTVNDGSVITGPKVLLANGAKAQTLLDQHPDLARSIPRLFYGIGAALVIKPATLPQFCIRTANRGLACGLHVIPYADHQSLYVGATNLISPTPEIHPRVSSVHMLLNAVMEEINIDYYKCQISEVRVGYRPTSADTFPLTGPTSVEGLYILSGTKREGIHVSPLYSAEMAKCIYNGDDCFQGKFHPERKLIRSLTKEEGLSKGVAHLRSAAYQHEFHLPKNGWDKQIEAMLLRRVEEVYEIAKVADYGIPPELLDMYRYGHIR